MRIYKYPLEIVKEQKITLYKGAVILSVQVQDNVPVIWALIDDMKESEERTIYTFLTGEDLNYQKKMDAHFIGTFQLGWFVGHVFEEIPSEYIGKSFIIGSE